MTTLRSGMAAIIDEVRGLTEAGIAEYTLGTTVYWGDLAIQDMLDVHRTDLTFFQMSPYPVVVQGGTLQWFEYRVPFQYFEATNGGTDIFYIQDGAGATQGTSLWSEIDYRRGVLKFNINTRGTSYYVTGRTYDLNACAADIWRLKAAHYAPGSFNFSTDNHSIQREQVYTHCKEMAAFFESISGDAISTAQMDRGDAY